MAQTPTCPRCGYDLSGIVASWTNSCPLTGICSECGLAFAWRDLLNPRFRVKPMLFEHVQTKLVRSFFYTLWRVLRPASFWRWVRLEDRVDSWRLLTVVTLGLLPMSLFVASVVSLVAMMLGAIASVGSKSVPFAPLEWVAAALLVDGENFYYFDLPPWAQPVPYMLALSIAPAALLIFGDSMRMAQTRRIHILRVWGYTVVLVPMCFGLMGLARILPAVIWWVVADSQGLLLPWGSHAREPSVLERILRFMLGRWSLVGAVLCIALFAWVIHLATVRYLRLKSAWFVTTSLTVIAGLLGAVLVTLAELLKYPTSM